MQVGGVAYYHYFADLFAVLIKIAAYHAKIPMIVNFSPVDGFGFKIIVFYRLKQCSAELRIGRQLGIYQIFALKPKT